MSYRVLVEEHPRIQRTVPSNPTKLIAFFLTQFHPIPENDEWWGKGFTEWTNVTKAAPLFPGHYQPHLPTDMGFYDLRLRETRREQIALAKSYGIDGFCYHYYWFSGRRLLEQPLNDMLQDPESDMPFCLCWANENWSRRWDAAEREILIAQQYLPDDDLNFIKDLVPVFRDPRYIRHNGAPLLIVYRPQNLPDTKRTLDVWRNHCREVGIGELHLCAAMSHSNWDFKQHGFDSGIEFPPHNLRQKRKEGDIHFYEHFDGIVFDYKEVAEYYLDRSYCEERSGFRGVFPSWDNTARRGSSSVIILNGTPENYEYWLKEAVRRTQQDFPGQERFVFINAWNEWAEGCHLEPDRRYGRKFLESTKRVKDGVSTVSAFSSWGVPEEALVRQQTAKMPPFEAARLLIMHKLGYVENELTRFRKRMAKSIAKRVKRLSDRRFAKAAARRLDATGVTMPSGNAEARPLASLPGE